MHPSGDLLADGSAGHTGFTGTSMWMDPVTENPAVGATEVWEIYNATADAHPMHIHEITFEVLNREKLVLDEETGEPVLPVQLSGDVRSSISGPVPVHRYPLSPRLLQPSHSGHRNIGSNTSRRQAVSRRGGLRD
mgnify:CR=1 FL=1